MTLSIVVPTIGRPSLAVTLGSFAKDLQSDDEVVVVADDNQRDVERMVTYMRKRYPGRWVFVPGKGEGCWGQPARNRGFDKARGTHWATIDDDDIYRSGALAAMRDGIAANPTIPTVFKCYWGPGHFAHGVKLWTERVIRMGTIATPMIVAPRSECRFGHTYAGDFSYALALEDEFGSFAWDERLIAEVRPAITSRDVAL